MAPTQNELVKSVLLPVGTFGPVTVVDHEDRLTQTRYQFGVFSVHAF